MSLTLIGLGVKADDLSVAALREIKNADIVLLKTDLTENYPVFAENGISAVTMDDLYKKSRNFDTLKKNITARVTATAKGVNAVYCVDGSVLEDNVCKHILKKHPEVRVVAGVSKVSECLERAGVFGGYSAVSAYDLLDFDFNGGVLCVYDIDSAVLAGEIKLKLMEEYGDECPCLAFYGAERKEISLYEADMLPRYDYTTRLVITPRDFLHKDGYDFNDLCRLIAMLRAENGCPWDRAQTHESIRSNAIEEVYELVDAIDTKDDERLTEEIGDVFMQAVFHTVLGAERGALTRGEVFTGVCRKLIGRHTHIFFGDRAETAEEALDVWNKNKLKEHNFTLKQAVADVPAAFPALMRAQKIQKRAERAGWRGGSKKEAEEAVIRLAEKLASDTENNAITRDSGDFLFACANLVRLCGGDSETELKDASARFLIEFTGEER